jgi:hypothetical protein
VLEKQQQLKLLKKYLKRSNMAISSVTNVPQDYRTVYNPIEYVALSDATTRAKNRFKYIFDVYDGATLLARLKVPADPNGYGRCDVHGVCESYLKTDLGTINSSATGTGFTDNANSYKEFTIKIGEEYDVAGVLTPDLAQETRTVLTYNGCLPNYRGSTLNFSEYSATNYYQNYVNNGTSRKWLTNAPKGSAANKSDNQSVELTDEGWAYFLYDHASHPVTAVEITLYNAAGSTTATHRIENGISAGTLAGIKMLKVPFAPNTINNILPADFSVAPTQPIITNETSYKISLKNSGSVVSEEMYFNIDSECRYTTRRLEFLNSLGGFDAFNFTKVSRMSEQIERKYYKQNAEDMSSGVISYNLSDKQKTQYYTKSKTKMKLTSDWVDAATFNWLLELIESPEVYLHEGGERIAVQGIEGEWEEKRAEVDTVFNLVLTIEFGVDNYRQRF